MEALQKMVGEPVEVEEGLFGVCVDGEESSNDVQVFEVGRHVLQNVGMVLHVDRDRVHLTSTEVLDDHRKAQGIARSNQVKSATEEKNGLCRSWNKSFRTVSDRSSPHMIKRD